MAPDTWHMAWFLLSFFKMSVRGIQGNKVYWDLQLYLCSVFGNGRGRLPSFLKLICPTMVPTLQCWGFSTPPALGDVQDIPSHATGRFPTEFSGPRIGRRSSAQRRRISVQQRKHWCFLPLWAVQSGLPWRAASSCYRCLFKKDISITQKT